MVSSNTMESGHCFDILPIGNGTQSIAWQINEETYRQTLESEGGAPNAKTGPQIYYGSIHDILSYPCEVTTYALHDYRFADTSFVRMGNPISYKQPPFRCTNHMDNTSRTSTSRLTRPKLISGTCFTRSNIVGSCGKLKSFLTGPEGQAMTS